MRLVQPFIEVMKQEGLSQRALCSLERADETSRISARTALELLDHAVRLTQDPSLGLRAAIEHKSLDADLLQYAAGSCATLGAAIDVLCRFYSCIRDANTLRVEGRGGRVHLSLEHPITPSRPLIDYSLGVTYTLLQRRQPGESGWTAHFTYPQPADLSHYPEVFEGAAGLCFASHFDGFTFDEKHLLDPLERADPELNRVLIRCVEDEVADLPLEQRLVYRVRRLIIDELGEGDPSARHIAEHLGVSRRTLTRRLEEEGTSFKALLGDVRCAVAQRHLLIDRLPITEIVARLGYSEPAGFHKAFKRWFGQTPIEYLRRHRPGAGRGGAARA